MSKWVVLFVMSWALEVGKERRIFHLRHFFTQFFFAIFQYLLHLKSNTYNITSRKSYSLSTFQQYQKHTPISLKNSMWFHWIFRQNDSIFKNLCIISLNITKPPQGTPSHEELSNGAKRDKGHCSFKNLNHVFFGGEISSFFNPKKWRKMSF
jgi:hypothetical protein